MRETILLRAFYIKSKCVQTMIQAKHLPKWRIKSTNEINCNRQPSFQAIINLKFIIIRRKRILRMMFTTIFFHIILFCTIKRFIIALFLLFLFFTMYKNRKLNFDNFPNFLFTNPMTKYHLNLLPNSTPEQN